MTGMAVSGEMVVNVACNIIRNDRFAGGTLTVWGGISMKSAVMEVF